MQAKYTYENNFLNLIFIIKDHVLTNHDKYEQVEALLLEDKNLIHQTSPLWGTCLHVAVKNNLINIVLLLLREGADINVRDNNQATPLHYTACSGYAILMSILCQYPELSINQVDEEGNTALHLSAKYHHPECINILVKASKSVYRELRNNNKETAEDIIMQIEDTNKRQILINSLYSMPLKRMSQDYKTGLFGAPMKIKSDKNLSESVQDNLKSIKLNAPEFFLEEETVPYQSTSHLPIFNKNKRSKEKAEKRKSAQKTTSNPQIESILKKYEQEKGDVDVKISEEEKKLEEVLLVYGLEHSYPSSEVALWSENDFSQILASTKTNLNGLKADCLQAVFNLCMGKKEGNQLKIDMLVIYKNTIGLLIYYKPSDVISALFLLSKHFSNHQNLISHIVVKNIILLSFDFEYGLSDDEVLNESFLKYLNNNCSNIISTILSEIRNVITTFQTSFVYHNYKSNIINTAADRVGSLINISERIDLIVKNKHLNIYGEAQFLALELNNITAAFYQKCSIDNYNKKDKNIQSCLQMQMELFNALTSFIQYHILIQQSPKLRARAITLFVATAKECLSFYLGPDLNSMVALFVALESVNITRLKDSFALLDKNTLSLMGSIKKIADPIGNFKLYRDFSKVYQDNFPYLGFILRENMLIPEGKSSHASTALLGQLFLPLINLRKKLQFCIFKNNSDLLFQLMEQTRLSDSEMAKLSFIAEPVIPYFSSKNSCSLEDFSYSLKKFKQYDYPLTIIYKKKSFAGEESLEKIYLWLCQKRKSEEITDEQFKKIYSECCDFILREKKIDSCVPNQTNATPAITLIKDSSSSLQPKKIIRPRQNSGLAFFSVEEHTVSTKVIAQNPEEKKEIQLSK